MTKKQKITLELSIVKSVLDALCDPNNSSLQHLVNSFDHESFDNIEDLRNFISSIAIVLNKNINRALDTLL